jgi:hypothetical protein
MLPTTSIAIVVIQPQSQAGWFTADNVGNNDTALREFGKAIDPDENRWDPVQRWVR